MAFDKGVSVALLNTFMCAIWASYVHCFKKDVVALYNPDNHDNIKRTFLVVAGNISQYNYLIETIREHFAVHQHICNISDTTFEISNGSFTITLNVIVQSELVEAVTVIDYSFIPIEDPDLNPYYASFDFADHFVCSANPTSTYNII